MPYTKSLASIKSTGSRKLNSQGGRRDMLSQRKSTSDHDALNGLQLGGDADSLAASAQSKSAGKPTYDIPPAGVSKSQKDMNRFY